MVDRRSDARRRGAAIRRLRGMARGRATRRALARGGTGPARRLNDALAGWSDVRITPMFGRWGYFVRGQLFACFPLRPQERDLWVRLPLAQQSRALAEAGVRPHRRFGRQGWIEMEIETERDVDRALRWLRQAHSAALARAARASDEEDHFA
jgi:Luciferase